MKNKYNLFLDDERIPYSPNGKEKDAFNYTKNQDYINLDWLIVRSYDKFIKCIIMNGLPELVSFDHDIADFTYEYEKTGYDCVKWLSNYCLDNNKKFPKYLIHTGNNVGSKNMLEYIRNFKKNCE